jgi:peptide/nickel transport system substrate-binding protein
VRLSREVIVGEGEETRHEEVLLSGAPAGDAIAAFAANKADLVLGGTFADLPLTQKFKLPGGALRFDPASGLFGLVPLHKGGGIDDPDVRHLLSEALDRTNFVSVIGVPGLVPRATLLEPGLDGIGPPIAPAWFGTPLGNRLSALKSNSDRLFGKAKPVIRVALPEGPGADLLFQELVRDWGAVGLTVERSKPETADFALVDKVAPSSSPAWFVRQFRCAVAPICDPQADELMEAARLMPVPGQRYALLAQAAARIENAQLFIPITAPVRWSLVSGRIQNFGGNRYASHTLTDLEQQPGRD